MSSMIPTETILPKIERLKELEGLDNRGLAFRVDLGEGTISHLLCGDYPEVEFDMIDQILCKLWAFNLWRDDPELRVIFESVDLSEPGTFRRKVTKRCALKGCSNEFEATMPWRKYCGENCKMKAYRRRRAEGKPKRYGTKYGECPRGHDRSPENTYIHPTRGIRQCRVCRREDMGKRMLDNDYRIRQRDRERKRRAERSEEVNARRRELYAARKAAA